MYKRGAVTYPGTNPVVWLGRGWVWKGTTSECEPNRTSKIPAPTFYLAPTPKGPKGLSRISVFGAAL